MYIAHQQVFFVQIIVCAIYTGDTQSWLALCGCCFSGRGEEKKQAEPEFKNPRLGSLFNKWRHVWLMALERKRKLQDMLDRLNEVWLENQVYCWECNFMGNFKKCYNILFVDGRKWGLIASFSKNLKSRNGHRFTNHHDNHSFWMLLISFVVTIYF